MAPPSTTTTAAHTSTNARDNNNVNRRSGSFESNQHRIADNNNTTSAIEASINKCIQATKSLSIQSNDESPPASLSSPPPPSQSSTLNAIGSDKNHMGSGTKYKKQKKNAKKSISYETKEKLRKKREPKSYIIIIEIRVFFVRSIFSATKFSMFNILHIFMPVLLYERFDVNVSMYINIIFFIYNNTCLNRKRGENNNNN